MTFPDDPQAQAVVDAIYRYFDALLAAEADPTNGELVQALLATTTEPRRTTVQHLIDDLNAGDYAYVANPDQPAYVEIFPPTVVSVDGVGAADGCAVASEVLVSVDSATGEQEVVDDSVISVVTSWSVSRSDDGVWRVSRVDISNSFEGAVGCE